MREIESYCQQNEEFLNKMRHDVEVNLARENIPARVEGRVKRAYSIYQKMKRQKIGWEQVYVLLALRIITDSVKNCYAALGVIHNEWPPIPGRIKDFIAIPRPNLYESLHTSVIGPGGKSCEVQIRTDEMHRLAEEGIAAHWKYKEGRKGPGADDQRIIWLRQLVEWQKELRDPGEFMSTLKVDLYPEEVYTFTPKGRVIVLPRDATPIDFAYSIHSDVGNTCVGAKVNARSVRASAEPTWNASPGTMAAARSKICMRPWDMASFPRGKCCRSWRRIRWKRRRLKFQSQRHLCPDRRRTPPAISSLK